MLLAGLKSNAKLADRRFCLRNLRMRACAEIALQRLGAELTEAARCAGDLEPGEHALLHVWLAARQRGDTVTLQGFGHLQPLDVLRADRQIGHVRAVLSRHAHDSLRKQLSDPYLVSKKHVATP